MPLHADAPRGRIGHRAALEWVLRVAALACLAWMLWRALHPAARDRAVVVDQTDLASALIGWSTVTAPSAVHARLDAVPTALERDWLAALRHAGTVVTWEHAGETPFVATAVVAEPAPDPGGGVRVAVAAPIGARVVLRDGLGPLDSTVSSHAGVLFLSPTSARVLSVRVGPTVARAAVTDSLILRPALVLSGAGWESKFIVRSLEEEGWVVDVDLAVAPGHDVMGGPPTTIDTAHYALVVAVDSVAARRATALAAFVRSGGGLILAGAAARALPALAAGSPGARIAGLPLPRDVPDSAPRSALGLVPVTHLAPDAIALERRGEAVAIAARRVANGRVLQVGYDDTWRWRLTGGDSAMVSQRAWWASLAGAVAYAPALPRGSSERVDPAPLAAMYERLGAPTASAEIGGSRRAGPLLPVWAFALIVGVLLAEWASRRLRGVR